MVELFLIDSAKDFPALLAQSHAVWPMLRPGSVIVLMDFAFVPPVGSAGTFTVPGFVYSYLVRKGMAKLLWPMMTVSSFAFELTEEYAPDEVLAYMKRHTAEATRLIGSWDEYQANAVRDVEVYTREAGYLATDAGRANVDFISKKLGKIFDLDRAKVRGGGGGASRSAEPTRSQNHRAELHARLRATRERIHAKLARLGLHAARKLLR